MARRASVEIMKRQVLMFVFLVTILLSFMALVLPPLYSVIDNDKRDLVRCVSCVLLSPIMAIIYNAHKYIGVAEMVSKTRGKYGKMIHLVYGFALLVTLVVFRGHWYACLFFSALPAIIVSVVRLHADFVDSTAVAGGILYFSAWTHPLLVILSVQGGLVKNMMANLIFIPLDLLLSISVLPCPVLKHEAKDCLPLIFHNQAPIDY